MTFHVEISSFRFHMRALGVDLNDLNACHGIAMHEGWNRDYAVFNCMIGVIFGWFRAPPLSLTR